MTACDALKEHLRDVDQTENCPRSILWVCRLVDLAFVMFLGTS